MRFELVFINLVTNFDLQQYTVIKNMISLSLVHLNIHLKMWLNDKLIVFMILYSYN